MTIQCWTQRLALLSLLLAVQTKAQLTPVALAPEHVYGTFVTTEGNGGVFYGERVNAGGLYNKTVVTFSGSDSTTGTKCAVFKPTCSATSTIANGFEKIIAQSADGRWTATCDAEAGVSSSGPNVGFAWGGGCHGWFQIKKGSTLFIGFSPRWTKDNVGPNSGKLTFNIDLAHAK